MDQLLQTLEADPSNSKLLLDTLRSMSRKLSALQDGLIAIEPTLPPPERTKLRGILAQDMLLDE